MGIEGLPAGAAVLPSPATVPADAADIKSADSGRAAVVSAESNNGVHSTGTISSDSAAQQSEQIARPGLQQPDTDNGPANDAYEMLAALVGSNDAKPQRLLQALANQAGNTSAAFSADYRGKLNEALDRQIAGLTANELKQASERLNSPATKALLATLHEGTGTAGLKNRNLTEQILRQMTNQLHQLQIRFGTGGSGTPAPAGARTEARARVDEFVRKFDDGLICQKGTVDRQQAEQIRENREICDRKGLESLGADTEIPYVCEQFCKDVVRDQYIIEHADGQREFLIPLDKRRGGQQQAAARLLEFCGNDQEKALLVSRLANQGSLAGANRLHLDRIGAIELPKSDGLAHFLKESYTNTNYLIRQNQDGTYSVFADHLKHLALSQDIVSSVNTHLNSNLSRDAVSVRLEVSADNNPSFGSIDYEMVIAPLQTGDGVDSDALEELSQEDQTNISRHEAIGTYGIDGFSEFTALGADAGRAKELAGDVGSLKGAIESSGIDNAQKEALLKRIDFAFDARAEIDSLIASGTAADADQAILRAGDLNSDLRLLQQDLNLKLEAWTDGSGDGQLATLTAATFAALGGATSDLEGIAADLSAALDDARGSLGEVAAGALLARAENAMQQSEASVVALSRLLIEQQTDSPSEVPEQLAELLAEARQRHDQARENHREVQSGGATNRAAGPGVPRKEERRQLQQELAAGLARGEGLPATHPRLSEADIFQARIDHLRSSNPELAASLANFERDFAQAAEDAGNNRSWQTIEKTFSDIDGEGRLHRITSRIVPAKQLAAGFSGYGGYGNGVSSHSRTSGLHLSNLASSRLVDSSGRTVFSGLRHGIIDAYTITPEKLSELSDDRLAQLHANTLAGDSQWQQWAAGRGGGTVGSDITLIRGSADAARMAAGRAKEVANLNAAQELVRAAIVDSDLLYERAVSGQPVDVTIDSVSLVTPDYARGVLGLESERDMQAGQRAALTELARQPFDLQLRDRDGNPHTVRVKVNARDFNFGVNAYSLSKGSKVPMFKKMMGWDAADKRNTELLTGMLGPIGEPALGGEVGQVLKYLEDGIAPDSMSPQMLNALTNDRNSAFANSATRARAIRLLADQIKQIYRSGDHRIAGIEPYKLVSRLAVLSNLLGHTTCYNCKSGKDRTGQLDAEAKMLAHRLSLGELPEPETPADQLRKSNFVLKTGNLEMQKYNSGLEGYRIDVKTLHNQMHSPLARELFIGDSESVAA